MHKNGPSWWISTRSSLAPFLAENKGFLSLSRMRYDRYNCEHTIYAKIAHCKRPPTL